MLVGNCCNLTRVVKQASDEIAPNFGKLVASRRIVEGVLITFEKREVRVHSRTLLIGKRLGHKGCEHSLRECDLFDEGLRRHNVVSSAQRVNRTQLHLILSRTRFMM